MALDETHDPTRRSWLDSANRAGADFPLQNLPFGIFRSGAAEPWRGGVAIGDRILDLGAARRAGLFTGDAADAAEAAAGPALNPLMALGKPAWLALRRALSRLLGPEGASQRSAVELHLRPMQGAALALPAAIGDYTDFYASIHHATNSGRMLRPDNPLLPNYKWIPVAYHGRASSVVPSGAAFRRPKGQIKPRDSETPIYAASRALDFELELGFFIGPGNALGESIAVDTAEDSIFGFCLLNDWSARDIQGWEYQPLGPFLGKSFATTISPWVVTAAALAPFRCAPETRPAGDPAPLPYLAAKSDPAEAGLDIAIEALLATARMRESGAPPQRIALCNARNTYWSVAQMVTHHASNGCNLRPGDLMGTGTLSGPEEGSLGSLLELTRRGSTPVKLANGEERRWLEDGDELILKGRAERAGHVGIGLGEARAVVLPAA